MKSKKDILDKYEQGEFTNYKNESPPKTTQDQLISNAIRSSAQTASMAEEAYKQRAISFGEWLRHNCHNRPIKDNEFSYWELKSELGQPVTTEQLYDEFIKSV